ncbi:MAG: neutral zinc metallopeptidase [Vicinamibacterales bacterium]
MAELIAALAMAALAVGCGGGGKQTSTAISTEAGYTVPQGGERRGAVPKGIRAEQPFTLHGAQGDDGGIDFNAYDETMNDALGAINEYWAETLPNEFGVEWVEPDEFIAYYPPEQEGPSCGGEPVGPENAVYCFEGDSDFIAWDEPGLMLPFYAESGGMANAVVLAHEFGHGVQARLELSDKFKHTIEAELQADCFAGAWAQRADEQGLLTEDDADQAVDAVVAISDPEGVPWNDPDAHGVADERLQAFSDGFDGGAKGCVEDYASGFSEEG